MVERLGSPVRGGQPPRFTWHPWPPGTLGRRARWRYVRQVEAIGGMTVAFSAEPWELTPVLVGGEARGAPATLPSLPPTRVVNSTLE